MAFRQTAVRFSQKSRSKSASWVARQQRDPFVKKRQSDPLAYRARSAFKLLEINSEWHQFLDHPDVNSVVDLGAAPGGWSQVVASKFGWTPPSRDMASLSEATRKEDVEDAEEPMFGESVDSPNVVLNPKAKRKKTIRKLDSEAEELDHFDPLNIDDLDSPAQMSHGRGRIVAVDLLNIAPIPGVQTIKADFMLDSTTQHIQSLLCTLHNPQGKADVILSDMAGNSSGHVIHDIQSSLEICEAVFDFARWNLRSAESVGRRKGGVLLMKFFAHPLLEKFRSEKLEPNFHHVYFIKPESSRAASREGYFLCQGWDP